MATWQFGGFAPDFIGPDQSPYSIVQTFSGTVLNIANKFTLDFGTKSYSNQGAAPVGLTFTAATGIYSAAGAVTPGTYAMTSRCSGSDSPPSYTDYSWTLIVSAALSAPLFSGPIDDQQFTGDFTFDVSGFATGETSYTITALPTGLAFNTATGVFTGTAATLGPGFFGPFTVGYVNATGTTNSNAFNITALLPDTGPGDFSDTTLQALLDPNGNFTGIRIIRRMDAGNTVNYYVIPVQTNRGVARWVEVLATDDAAARANKIIIATSIPSQPTWPLP